MGYVSFREGNLKSISIQFLKFLKSIGRKAGTGSPLSLHDMNSVDFFMGFMDR